MGVGVGNVRCVNEKKYCDEISTNLHVPNKQCRKHINMVKVWSCLGTVPMICQFQAYAKPIQATPHQGIPLILAQPFPVTLTVPVGILTQPVTYGVVSWHWCVIRASSVVHHQLVCHQHVIDVTSKEPITTFAQSWCWWPEMQCQHEQWPMRPRGQWDPLLRGYPRQPRWMSNTSRNSNANHERMTHMCTTTVPLVYQLC